MRGYGETEEVVDEEQVIDEFLGEQPRARELRLMRAALEQRRDGLAKERGRAPDDKTRTSLTTQIAELEKQIQALHDEEEITKFVEGSVRATLHKPSREDMEEDY